MSDLSFIFSLHNATGYDGVSRATKNTTKQFTITNEIKMIKPSDSRKKCKGEGV